MNAQTDENEVNVNFVKFQSFFQLLKLQCFATLVKQQKSAQIMELLNSSKQIQFKKGEILTSPGPPLFCYFLYSGIKMNYVYLLLSGSVNVFLKKSPENLTEERQGKLIQRSRSISQTIGGEVNNLTEDKQIKLLRRYKFFNKLFGENLKIQDIQHHQHLFTDDLFFEFYFIKELKKGLFIGDICFFCGQRYTQLTIFNQNSLVQAIQLEKFKILFSNQRIKFKKQYDFISEKCFTDLTKEALNKIVPYFQKSTLKNGQVLYSEGEELKNFYLILEGEITLFKLVSKVDNNSIEDFQNLNNKNEKYQCALLSGGEYFGEEEMFLKINMRLLTAQCTSVYAKVYQIPQTILNQFLKQKPTLKNIFEEKCQIKLKWRQNFSFQAFLQKKRIQQEKNQEQFELENSKNNLESGFQKILNEKKSIQKNSESSKDQLVNIKILNKIKINQIMEDKLKSYQYLDLNNIPMNQQLINKAIFKHLPKQSSHLSKYYLNKNTKSISDLLNFGKLRGLNLQSTEKQYNFQDSNDQKINQSQEKSKISETHRVGRSMSQYLIKISMRNSQKRKKS